MKIDSGIKQAKPPASVENHSTQPKANKSDENRQPDVTLGTRAEELRQLESQLASIPVVDQARVDTIKEAITGGRYTINIENVAEALIKAVKEMLHVAK